jgi:hypothetical protein
MHVDPEDLTEIIFLSNLLDVSKEEVVHQAVQLLLFKTKLEQNNKRLVTQDLNTEELSEIVYGHIGK